MSTKTINCCNDYVLVSYLAEEMISQKSTSDDTGQQTTKSEDDQSEDTSDDTGAKLQRAEMISQSVRHQKATPKRRYRTNCNKVVVVLFLLLGFQDKWCILKMLLFDRDSGTRMGKRSRRGDANQLTSKVILSIVVGDCGCCTFITDTIKF